MKMTKAVLYYFDGRGRAEVIRWMLAACDIEVSCSCYKLTFVCASVTQLQVRFAFIFSDALAINKQSSLYQLQATLLTSDLETLGECAYWYLLVDVLL